MLAKLLLGCHSDKNIMKDVTDYYLNKRVLRRLMNRLKDSNRQFLETRNPKSLEEALLATFARPDLVKIRTRGSSGQNWQNKNTLSPQHKIVTNIQKTQFANKTNSPQNVSPCNLVSIRQYSEQGKLISEKLAENFSVKIEQHQFKIESRLFFNQWKRRWSWLFL